MKLLSLSGLYKESAGDHQSQSCTIQLVCL